MLAVKGRRCRRERAEWGTQLSQSLVNRVADETQAGAFDAADRSLDFHFSAFRILL